MVIVHPGKGLVHSRGYQKLEHFRYALHLPLATMQQHITDYVEKLTRALHSKAMDNVPALALALRDAWTSGRSVYVCGNGGSAGNAMHLANDLLFGVGRRSGGGIRVEALSANPSVVTCLANDLGYEEVFAHQLEVKGVAGDVLIVLSGSGNSPNVVKALEKANAKGMKTFAVLGYSGGKCKDLAQHSIHFDINDMQIAEDMQLVVGHMCMQWLCEAAAR